MRLRTSSAALSILVATLLPAAADFVILDDLIVDGNACLGFDCVNNENFGFDVLRLKDNNIRLHLQDTSTTAGFTANDWRITVNGELNGDPNFFSIDDVSAQTVPVRIDAAAPTDALRVSGEGPIGMGTGLPEMALHIRDGDSPAVRLEQDTSQANAAQSWDIGGNESNFFIRDPGTSTLPFRIRPGAPNTSIIIAGDGEVGMGIVSPKGGLHIRRNQPNNVPHLILEATRSTGRSELWFMDGRSETEGDALRQQLNGDAFNISFNGTGGVEFQVAKSGDVSVPRGNLTVPNGSIVVGGSTLIVPDYVFHPDYALMSLDAVQAFTAAYRHLPHLPSAAEIQAGGLDMVEMQLAMLRTLEEFALHSFALEARLAALEAENARLRKE